MSPTGSGPEAARSHPSSWLQFREDAARWIRPQEIAALSEVTPKRLVTMLLRHPPLRAMAWFRLGGAMHRRGVRGVPAWVQRRLLRLYGLEIAPSMPVGGGLYIAHPVGCVLMAEEIGRNVSVVAQVTFGTRTDARWPRIGDEAYIGAGARVLGGIEIGAGAQVGANAVVIDDVPAGAVAVGVPATIRHRRPAGEGAAT